MAEYIDIDAPIDFAVYERNRRIKATLRQLLEANDAKYEIADVRPVAHAKWTEHQWGDWAYVKCSRCEAVHYGCTNFCPTCGADMRESET